MCVHGFQGKGYSPAFVRNFWQVVERLKNEDIIVEAVAGTKEDICAPCPNNQGETCVEETKIKKLDDAYAATLEIKTGEQLSWKDAKKLIVKKVTDEAFEKNCEPCGWKRLGYCKIALEKLRTSVALLAVMFLSILGSAQASQAQIDVSTSSVRVLAIDELEQKILLDKNRNIAAFSKVQAALQAGKFDTALKAVKGLENNIEFKDYFHFLSGQASMGRMKKFVKSGQLANALLAGEQASFHFIQVIGTNPYTTLERRSSAMLGETEVTLAETYAKRKQRSKARALYENGFQRLDQGKLMVMVPTASIVSYALICEKQRTDVCGSWVAKLAPLVAKSEEAKILSRIAAAQKKPYVERSTTVSYRVDLDAQEFKKGFEHYLAERYDDAFISFRDLLREYPRTNIKLRTKFWMARTAQKSGHGVQAETLYREVIKDSPFSYYAMLASWYGGIDISRVMEAELPIASAETSLLTPAEVVHVHRAETLIASKVPELALLELQNVRPTSSMPNEFLVYLTVLNHLAGNHQAAFQVFYELTARNFSGLYSSYGQKLFFPAARMPLIREASKDWKVDPLLVLSVIKQESAFNQDAMSYANAYGLMQIIPPTARGLDPSIDAIELFNPATNVKLGTKYISQLMTRFKGNVVLTLAGYNAGPGNANRWSREIKGGLPTEEFIEQISFTETRGYVQNILRNFYWYNRRLRGETFPSLGALMQHVTPAGLPTVPVKEVKEVSVTR